MGPSDLARDRQSEARAACPALSAGIQADEALEDPFPVDGGDPGAVVADVEQGISSLSADPERAAVGRVSGGIVGEVAQPPGELVMVAPHPYRCLAHDDLQAG